MWLTVSGACREIVEARRGESNYSVIFLSEINKIVPELMRMSVISEQKRIMA